MRTPSQELSQILFENPKNMLPFLQQFSWRDNYPLKWISLAGYCLPEWMEIIEDRCLPTPEESKAFLAILVAQRGTSWRDKERLADFFMQHLNPSLLQKEHFAHRAAIGNQGGMIKMISERYGEYDANALNEDGHTALFLAMSHMNTDATLALLHSGSSENFRIKHRDGKSITVLDAVMEKNKKNLEEFKTFWKAVRTKYLLEKDIGYQPEEEEPQDKKQGSKRKI